MAYADEEEEEVDPELAEEEDPLLEEEEDVASMSGMPEAMPEASMPPEPMGAFQSMLNGNMPGPAELNDLLGEGDSFHDSFQPEPYSVGEARGGGGPSMDMGGTTADYTGQAPYDPDAVKEDVRALLTQRAQERSAASEEFQARALGMMGRK